MEPICEIRLPAHHPAVKMARGGMVRIKAKAVPAEEYEKKPFDRTAIESPRVQPLEQRYHVMGIESEDEGEDPKEEAAETAAQERAENRPASRKKAKTPAELIRQKRAGK